MDLSRVTFIVYKYLAATPDSRSEVRVISPDVHPNQ